MRTFKTSPSVLCSDSRLLSWLCYLLELVVWSLLIYGTIVCFDLQVDTKNKSISSRTGPCAPVLLFHIPFKKKKKNSNDLFCVCSLHLPPVQHVSEERHHPLCLDRCPLSHLGDGHVYVQVLGAFICFPVYVLGLVLMYLAMCLSVQVCLCFWFLEEVWEDDAVDGVCCCFCCHVRCQSGGWRRTQI